MDSRALLLLGILLMPLLSNGAIETNETRLYNDLFKNYSKFTHPILDGHSNKSLRVEFDFQLIRIIDVSAKDQFIKTYAWVNQYWNNELMSWDPAKYGGIKMIHVDPRDVWVPDVLLYNNVDEEDRFGGGQYTYKANVAMSHNGHSTWLNPAIFKSICHVDVTYFPFDDQECDLKFGSWSFDISKVDLHPRDRNVMNKNYMTNGEWHLERITNKRNAVKYKCCEHAFVDVTITITISRVSLDYIMKLIIPCSLISSMIFLGFVLPPESGERIGLSITVLLAMTVFQQLTSELMPSYGFPLLGQYYFATMIEIGASLAVTTFILNFYHRSTRRMPRFLKTLILSWLANVAFPFRKKHVERYSHNGTRVHYSDGTHEDLMAMDGEDDSFALVESSIDHKSHRNNIWEPVEELNDNYSPPVTMDTNSMDNVNYSSGHRSRNRNNNRRVIDKGRIRRFRSKNHRGNQNGYATNQNRVPNQLNQARRGSHFVTGMSFGNLIPNAEYSDERANYKKEWMKAARVLDRLFLILSVLIGTVTLFAIFLRAPRFRLI